ncbi:hypothetical protein SAMN05720473_101276 [Fibrobacter sp. UWB15]|jgi:hypothetical protein|uniref:hypothetical protein n=1 Tax=unclassified Fibrobacter TaxID=2634177 RepID=UPI0009192ED0|nr:MULTISPECIES: hypothetical protein [unclassified Fibrobacter]PWJ67405.1 hypothetical protein BGW99_101276 [Fibrobacter sp. UWB6]SHF66657.1 hypothetical protein SAMN05720760_101241 [Fibrobacter sp. UWB8]SMG10292.1 hypothetical protein SAMN05720473_101276 [Fibrobacter sp. UWB15]
MFALRIFRIATLAMVTALLSGCYFGRSAIRTSDGGNYDIYADGRYICSTDGDCSITTRGGMGKTLFEAQRGDVVVGQDIVSREITFASVIWMPFTYCLSLFIYQAYPDEIVIPVNQDKVPQTVYSWQQEPTPVPSSSSGTTSTTGGSVWDKPIY